MSLGDNRPDAETIWLYREYLVEADTMNKLSDRSDKYIDNEDISRWMGRSLMQKLWQHSASHTGHYKKMDIKAGEIAQN